MNQTEGRASGEVPESQPSGDLAEQIAVKVSRDWYAASGENEKWFREKAAPLIRESLAPIREALERQHPGEMADALRLLRGEER